MNANGHKPDLPIDVSRETKLAWQELARLVKKWSRAINLVAPNTIDEIWDRHILDSAQLIPLFSARPTCVDIGSGGGFPGLVIAAWLGTTASGGQITLVESDKRKCAFLTTAARELEIDAKIVPERIEDLHRMNPSHLICRAFAPLPRFLTLVERQLTTECEALLLKGKSWEKEVESAQETWSFDLHVVQSITDASSVILRLKNMKRRS